MSQFGVYKSSVSLGRMKFYHPCRTATRTKRKRVWSSGNVADSCPCENKNLQS